MLFCTLFHNQMLKRKDMLSPGVTPAGRGPYSRAPLHLRKSILSCPAFSGMMNRTPAASLTVEAAVALPVFLFVMMAVLQLFRIYDYAQRSAAALAQTAEEMAIGAYVSGSRDEGKEDLPGIVLSAAFASARVTGLTGGTDAVKKANFLLSSFREEEEYIDLVLTWQMNSPVGMIPFPAGLFIQRGCVRAWMGREGSSGEKETEADDHIIVYVTENGSVYHRDRNCTHLKLAISRTSLEAAKSMRNVYLERYRQCEICGRSVGSMVYITTDGNRYHSTLDCPGLKRTVREVYLDEISLPPCSKCGG